MSYRWVNLDFKGTLLFDDSTYNVLEALERVQDSQMVDYNEILALQELTHALHFSS